MHETIGNMARQSNSFSVRRRLTPWHRRLLVGAAVLILWAASVLVLHAGGPGALSMIAGEGMLVTESE